MTTNGVRPYIHVLAYGSPGEGKSHFFATFPKPLIVLSFDPMGKNKPYFNRGKVGQSLEGELGQEIWPVFSSKDNQKLLVQVELFSTLAIEYSFQTLITKRIPQLYQEVADGQVRTVILDSSTSAELAARKMYERLIMPRAGNKEWAQGCTDAMEDLLCCKLLSLRCNVGVACHVDKDKDEVLGRMVGMPSAPGRLQRKEGLPARFAEIYRLHAVRAEDGKVERQLQTQTDQRYIASSVFLEAPDPCAPDYQALWQNWQDPS